MLDITGLLSRSTAVLAIQMPTSVSRLGDHRHIYPETAAM